jgi:hypothetical protein
VGRTQVGRCVELPTPPRLPVGLSQHPDEHRPEGSILLAVDQQLGERACLWAPLELADPVGSVEVREPQNVEQLDRGAGPRASHRFSSCD